MFSKINIFTIFLCVFIINTIISKEVDDNDEEQLFEGIIQAMKELKISYNSYEDKVDQRLYIKLLKHLMLNEIDTMGLVSNFIEDSFLLKLSKEVTENLPNEMKIKDLPKYLNPRIIEPIINKILQELDLGSLLKKAGDNIFGDVFDEQKKERDKKDKEREKINQERIKRKEKREQEMKKNITKEDKKDRDEKIEINKDL